MTMYRMVNGQNVEMTPDDEASFLVDQVNTSAPTVETYQMAVQRHVDDTARSKLFNDGVSLASYKDSTNPLWASQASAFIAWRDQVWAYCYAQLEAVGAGEAQIEPVESFLAGLPKIQWP